jgi:hypothetical protein
LLCPALAVAQVPEYEVKAEFLERFTRFVEWPAGSTVQDATTPFVIGVYGTNPFGSYLAKVARDRRIKGKPIEVRVVSSPDEAERCELLFVPGAAQRHLPAILARTADRPILTVSESPGAAEQGVLVNFYTAEDNLRFEINDAAVRRSRLEFSSRLLKLARVLNLEPRP